MTSTLDIRCGDALTELRSLPSESVNCCVTSPPYWMLRDYGVDGQLGLEKTPEEYVARLVEVFREVRRVLRKEGTLWLNLGDGYASSGPGCQNGGVSENSTLHGVRGRSGTYRETLKQSVGQKRNTVVGKLKPKDLIGVHWMVAFALRADGWWLRSEIIWHKPNPMPESITDRPTKAHEYLFLLAKSERYYYDAEEIAEPVSASMLSQIKQGYEGMATKDFHAAGVQDASSVKSRILGKHRKPAGWNTGLGGHGSIHRNGRAQQVEYSDVTSLKRNRRTVWTVPTAPYAGAHFATFPPDLIKPCILAGCPAGGVVLDPFLGSGTTGMVSLELGRSCIGIELNPKYCELARQRCAVTPGLQLT